PERQRRPSDRRRCPSGARRHPSDRQRRLSGPRRHPFLRPGRPSYRQRCTFNLRRRPPGVHRRCGSTDLETTHTCVGRSTHTTAVFVWIFGGTSANGEHFGVGKAPAMPAGHRRIDACSTRTKAMKTPIPPSPPPAATDSSHVRLITAEEASHI